MSEEKYIAAVEISSSKIIAAVGKTYGEGQLEVLAIDQEKGVEAVRYGIIQNLEETALRVSRLIARLENRPNILPRKIKGVFVGLSGLSLKSIPTEVTIPLLSDTEINEEILARLDADVRRTVVSNNLEIVDAVPRLYRIGNTETHSPIGMIGNVIQATFDLIVCRPELKRNISRTLNDKLGLRVDGFVVTALGVGHLILTNDEKRLGCMLVDMGAETTTVSIYRKSALCYFATLPFGGRNITRDIQSLSILEEQAEEIKITSGNALASDSPSILNLHGVKLTDVNNLVMARAEEIVANIVEQIEYAGLKETDLPGGIVCIGGGTHLQGILELLSQHANLPVRRGKLPSYVVIDDPKANSFESDQVVSVMYAGATLTDREGLEIPMTQELPSTGTMLPPANEPEGYEEQPAVPERKKPSRFSGFKERMARIFSGPMDDSELIDS